MTDQIIDQAEAPPEIVDAADQVPPDQVPAVARQLVAEMTVHIGMLLSALDCVLAARGFAMSAMSDSVKVAVHQRLYELGEAIVADLNSRDGELDIDTTKLDETSAVMRQRVRDRVVTILAGGDPDAGDQAESDRAPVPVGQYL